MNSINIQLNVIQRRPAVYNTANNHVHGTSAFLCCHHRLLCPPAHILLAWYLQKVFKEIFNTGKLWNSSKKKKTKIKKKRRRMRREKNKKQERNNCIWKQIYVVFCYKLNTLISFSCCCCCCCCCTVAAICKY